MANQLRTRGSVRTAVVWQTLRQVLTGLERQAGSSGLDILDAGGGTGGFAVPLAQLGHRVTVVDPSPDALAALERRAAETAVTELVRPILGDTAELLDLVGESAADLVLCHGVLEFVEEPAEALRAVHRALRAHGVASVLAANRTAAVLARALGGHFADARQTLTDPAGRWGSADLMPRRFSPDQLTELVESAGLRIRQVQGVRVFSDLVPGAVLDSEPGSADQLLALESQVADDPAFQAFATQLHLLAGRA